MMKNTRLLALAAATILSGCAQGGIDPFAGGSTPPAVQPAAAPEELQYFVRYPDGSVAPVAAPPSVVAGYGAPAGAGIAYAPPLVAQTGQPRFLGSNPGPAQPLQAQPAPLQASPVQAASLQGPIVAPSPAAAYDFGAPAPVMTAPAPVAAFAPPPAPRPAPAAAFAPSAPSLSAAPAPGFSTGFAPAATAPGVAQMDPELAAALRRQGIDPNEVVGLEYQGGAASLAPAAPAPRPAPAPGPLATAQPPMPRPPQPQAAAPAPTPAAAPASRASGGGAPQMDPAVAEALRRQGIDPSEVVGLQIEGGAAAVFGGPDPYAAPALGRQAAAQAPAGPVTRNGASGAPDASPAPRMSPVRSRGDRPAAGGSAASSSVAAAESPAPRNSPAPRPPASAPAPARQAAAPAPRPPAAAPAAPRAASGAAPSTGIAGSSWRLAMLRGQGVAPGVELHFDGAENFAGGSGPCSPYSFDFTESAGGALRVDGVGADPRACDRSAEEERYFTALNMVGAYRVTAQGNLELLGAGGAVLANFSPL